MTDLLDDDDDDDARAEELLADLARLAGQPCVRCAAAMCGHEHVISVVMGFKGSPVCSACLAGGLGRATDELRDDALAHIHRRDCFRQGWEHAGREEGFGAVRRPPCLWPDADGGADDAPAAEPATAAAAPQADDAWDAGDMSCGDLVLALRLRLIDLDPGAVIRVRATDIAAPVDLPAWCRLTGHALAHHAHPLYWIRKRRDP